MSVDLKMFADLGSIIFDVSKLVHCLHMEVNKEVKSQNMYKNFSFSIFTLVFATSQVGKNMK